MNNHAHTPNHTQAVTNRLVTVAIHTYDRAVELKHTLLHNGIEAVLQNVNLNEPSVSSGVRVRIHEDDLAQALRIIENTQLFVTPDNVESKDSSKILFPIDFTNHSLNVSDFVFRLADSLSAEIVFLNTYINPAISKRVQLTDSFSFELPETQDVDKRLYSDAQQRMDKLSHEIKSGMQSGALPAVKFTTIINEGVPEDVIVEWSKENHPILVVMGTRSAERKEKEMIGSITAEVLDSSRIPVMSVPETTNLHDLNEIKKVLFFANLNQDDIIAIDTLYRLFPKSILEVCVNCKIEKREDLAEESLQLTKLLQYCSSHYPRFRFTTCNLYREMNSDDFKRLINNEGIDLFAIPNKKRNVFSRLFKPSVAHTLLLNSDLPIISLPI